MNNIIGSELRRGAQKVGLEALGDVKFVAIYFGAHWAPPCRLFTKTLTEFYNETNKSHKQVEVVFVSIDGNEAAFERNFKEMPWLAVPYTDEPRIAALKQRFGINGIPTMVLVDSQGTVVTYDARKDIQKDPAECIKKWDEEHKQQLNLQTAPAQ